MVRSKSGIVIPKAIIVDCGNAGLGSPRRLEFVPADVEVVVELVLDTAVVPVSDTLLPEIVRVVLMPLTCVTCKTGVVGTDSAGELVVG